MNKLDFIYKRHSVRKFKDQDVPLGDINEIIKAATYAPSGKNLQNWHFIIIRNREKIQELAKVIENKASEIADSINNEDKKISFLKYLKYGTVFRNAPVTILIYAGPYPITGIDILEERGASTEEINELLRPSPGIQNIGAAMENLQLSAAALGYGTCWMTSSNFASKEISDFLGFEKEGYYLAAITPLGVPEEAELKSPPRKGIEEVMTIID